MTLKTKVICQERKVAAISKDHNLILECLKKCQQVQVLDQQSIRILAGGDALVIQISGNNTKHVGNNQIKRMVNPLLKHLTYQIKETTKQFVQFQFQTQISVNQFIQRIKSSGLPLVWQIKQKDPYECIKKSVRFLLKQRKNQQTNQYQSNPGPQVYYSQGYDLTTYGYNYNYGYNGDFTNQKLSQNSNKYYYQIFIRKAVDSDEQSLKNQEKNYSRKQDKQMNKNIQQDGKKKRKDYIEKQKQYGKEKNNGQNNRDESVGIVVNQQDFPEL